MEKCFFLVMVLWPGGLAYSQDNCCTSPSSISIASPAPGSNALQKDLGGVSGTFGGCGVSAMNISNGSCSVVYQQWTCSFTPGKSGLASYNLTYVPLPNPSGCPSQPQPAAASGQVYVDVAAPAVYVTSPQEGAWVRVEDNLTGVAQDDMQLFSAGAVSCEGVGCGSTGAFSFPAAAGITDFNNNIYYDNPKLKSAEWSVPLAGVVACGNNPQNIIVQVRDSVFHLTEQGFSFNADCYTPIVNMVDPSVAGTGWANPGVPVIKGIATDDGTIEKMWLTIKDESADRYWNGSDWEAGVAYVDLNQTGKQITWEYDGLTKDDLRSGNYMIAVYAKDEVGRVGVATASVGYKKILYLGKKDFTKYTVHVDDVHNITRSKDTDSFITASGDNVIGVSAKISPDRLSDMLLPYVQWDVDGANSVSGKPGVPMPGTPSQFTASIPPIPVMSNGRGMPLDYTAFARLEYDYEGKHYTSYAPNHWTITQDAVDQCLQEYIDLGKIMEPDRGDFVNATTYVNPGNFPFSEINSGQYSWAIFKIAKHLQDIRNEYGTMSIRSGYRNPIYNDSLKRQGLDPGKNSPHIYGEAADISVADDIEWTELCAIAVKYGACVEPYDNTGSWVHMDWRSYAECGPTWPHGTEETCD